MKMVTAVIKPFRLDDVREAITTLDGTVRIARRVLGGDHPTVSTMEGDLEGARAALCFREKYEVELSIAF